MRDDTDNKNMARRHSVTRRECLRASAAVLATAGAGGLLTSCSGGDVATSTGAGPTTKVTFLAVLPLTTLTYAPELLADAGGYFADQGLDVSFQSTRGTAQAIRQGGRAWWPS